jgi:DNA-damage-inducible protein D
MSNVKLFHDQQIRSHWDADHEQWLFSVIDIIQALTGSERPRKYWGDLKTKLNREGSEVSDKIGRSNDFRNIKRKATRIICCE